MTEAFPCDTAPRYLLRDRDRSYGPAFRHRVRAMGGTEAITAPRSPWQNPYVERLIGSIRRECLDHVIILNERHLRRVLSSSRFVSPYLIGPQFIFEQGQPLCRERLGARQPVMLRQPAISRYASDAAAHRAL
jgi:hypothetical protein